MSRSLKLAIGIVISVVCVWLSMRDVQPGEVWEALRRARGSGFIALMGTTLLAFWIRALRWKSLLPVAKPIRLGSLFSATMIGFMANNILPLRLGEFVRAWVLGRREQLSKTRVFATVVVERVVDMLTLIAILGIALLVHPLAENTDAGRLTRLGARALVVVCLGLTVFVVALERQPRRMNALVAMITRPLPERIRAKSSQALAEFVEGLGLFSDIPRLLWVFLLSFLMFGVVVLGLHASVWALSIDVPWYGGLLLLVITAIGIMVPAAPGFIGTMNLACIAGLALFAVEKERAVPFSWFYWAGQWLPVSVVGLYYLRREGLTLRTLGHVQDEPA
jgi:uncharacterized protein (TIRG00374 family)